jgi:hypothetical protein
MLSGGEVLQIEQQFLNQKSGKISKAFFSNLFINILRNRTELEMVCSILLVVSTPKVVGTSYWYDTSATPRAHSLHTILQAEDNEF